MHHHALSDHHRINAVRLADHSDVGRAGVHAAIALPDGRRRKGAHVRGAGQLVPDRQAILITRGEPHAELRAGVRRVYGQRRGVAGKAWSTLGQWRGDRAPGGKRRFINGGELEQHWYVERACDVGVDNKTDALLVTLRSLEKRCRGRDEGNDGCLPTSVLKVREVRATGAR